MTQAPRKAVLGMWQSITQFISKHPVAIFIGFLGAIASIIAVPLAIWFGVWPTLPKRELTYAIQPVRTAIARVSQPSDITIIYKGTAITGDLIAAQVRISNAGKEPIEGNDILSPVSLVVSNAKIVECSISVPAKQGTEFVIHSNVAVPLDRTNLSWKILERGDNPVIQVLYAGKAESPIYLVGRIKGQDAIMQTSWPSVGMKRRIPLPWAVALGSCIGDL